MRPMAWKSLWKEATDRDKMPKKSVKKWKKKERQKAKKDIDKIYKRK